MLTASGGPFRGRRREELGAVTPDQALAHPTWDMGPLVTTNSATLVNKGLEVIEAHLLFGIPLDRIEVGVHPQSVVHSMVEFTDGSTIAQGSPPDMRIPIALGLGWPDRVPDAAPPAATGRRAEVGVLAARRRGVPGGAPGAPGGGAGRHGSGGLQRGQRGVRQAFLAGRSGSSTSWTRSRAWCPTTSRCRSRIWPECSPPTPGRGPAPGNCCDAGAYPFRGSQQRGGNRLIYLVGVVIFVLGVLASIALHEIGHMVPAKKFGVKFTQYFIGFGPTLWSRQVGETEYGVKAIPLGGYVRMSACSPPARTAPAVSTGTGRWALLAEQARRRRAERDRSRGRRPALLPAIWWKKVVIMVGGPVMNLVVRRRPARRDRLRLRHPHDHPHGLDRRVSASSPPTSRTGRARRATRRPGGAGRLPARRPDRQLQRHAGEQLGAGPAGDPGGQRHPGAGRRPAGRCAVTLTVTPAVTQRPVLDANGNPVTGPTASRS